MQKDYLSRQPYIDLLKSIILNQSNNPKGYSFAIDGEWGSGKSWILNELESQLTTENKNKYLIFHYNAWENDFYDEPLVAILSVIISEIEKIYKKEQMIDGINAELAATALFLLKNLAISFVNNKVKDKTGIDFKDVVDDLKNIKKAKSKLKNVEKQVDTFLPLKNGIETIKKQLSEFSKHATIIFIVDELDRCLPEYAIKVLERLHHICNKMPVIQLLAINKKTLTDSIVKVFGKDLFKIEIPENQRFAIKWNEYFADSYLQKFVDVIIPLPNGKLDSRLEVLNGLEKSFKTFTRDDLVGEGINLNEEYLANFISYLFSDMERRQQEKIISLTSLCHKLALASGTPLELNSYAILIYEIISCICRYVFHLDKTCTLNTGNEEYYLGFFNGVGTYKNPDQKENNDLNNRLYDLLSCRAYYNEAFRPKELFPLEIKDTKTFMMAFFYDTNVRNVDRVIDGLWRGIHQDKIFLNKFDEIMNMLVIKEKSENTGGPVLL